MSIPTPVINSPRLKVRLTNKNIIYAKCVQYEEFLEKCRNSIISMGKRTSTVMFGYVYAVHPDKEHDISAGDTIIFNLLDKDMNPVAQPAEEVKLLNKGDYFVWAPCVEGILIDDGNHYAIFHTGGTSLPVSATDS